MATAPYWADDSLESNLWNFVWLGASLLPGIATVTVRKSRALDVQRGKGSDGAYIVDHGNEPASVSISLLITNKTEWDAWVAVLPSIDPQKNGGTKTPLDISHPEPNSMGITTVYVKDISGNPPTALSGKRIEIECIQWVEAPKQTNATKTPKGTAPAIVIPQTPDSADLF